MPAKSKPVTTPSELQIALDNRTFELQLFWQRSNYFLVLITALGIGVFSIQEPEFALLIALAATISSYFWFKTNLGSRFWCESWEAEVAHLAKEFGIRSFERPLEDITRQVEAGLEGSTSGKGQFIRKWVNREISKKPSVSYFMIQLSLCSTCLWMVVSLMLLFNIPMMNEYLSNFIVFCKDILNSIPSGLPII